MNKRNLVIAGNWKMETSHEGGVQIAKSVLKMLENEDVRCDIVMCPSFPQLSAVAQATAKSSAVVAVGAQNVHWEERGAWTGEVSVSQIKPFSSWCIVGHSERRQLTGETDEQVAAKVATLASHGLTPIACVGETEAERNEGGAETRVREQVQALTDNLDRTTLGKTVIAYEPIWAIGSGNMPDPDEVYQFVLLIRQGISNAYDADIAERVRILYGGSVKPDNIAQYVEQPGPDGVLVGGASVHPGQFVDIIRKAQEAFFDD